MPNAQGECFFCGRTIAKTRSTVCKCGVAYPHGLVLYLNPHSADGLDRADTGYFGPKREHDPDPHRDDQALLTWLESSDEEEEADPILAVFRDAERPRKPSADKEDREAVAQERRDRGWEKIAAKAKALAERQPWTLHEGGGCACLKRWVDRTEELRRSLPPDVEPPLVPPVFGTIWQVDGKPLVVPIRRKHLLQTVLDERTPGLRLADLVRSHARRGRRHQTRKETPEWQADRDEILRLKSRLQNRYGHLSEALANRAGDPDIARYLELRRKWYHSKRCRREDCLTPIPRSARREYCTDACKQRAKKIRSR